MRMETGTNADSILFFSRLLLVLVVALSGCSKSELERWTDELRSGDAKVRRQAAQNLADKAAGQQQILPALESALQDSDRDVRRLVARALGEFGPAAKSLRPKLETLLSDSETSVRLSAAFAIQKIDPQSTAQIKVRKEMMAKGDGGVIVALGELRPTPAWAVSALTDFLADHRPGVRRIVTNSLQRIGAAASPVKSALKSLAERDTDDRVREAAKEAFELLNTNQRSSM